MKPRASAALAALAAAAVLAPGRPARGQQAPQSLLPPGFGQPAPPPVARREPAAPAPAVAPPVAVAPPAPPPLPADGDALPDAADTASALPHEEPPEPARRAIDRVGIDGGAGEGAFGGSDGRYLAALMRRMRTPIASRWAEILLRRMLLAATPAPPGEAPADWVADRAALLLRLGEADGARLLVQAVDVAGYTPRLRAAAIRTALATSDPAGLCALPAGGEEVGGQPAWPMVRAICAALAGDVATASASIGRRPGGDFIDHPLAEKLVAAGGAGRRAVTIDWAGVDQLTDWRFGLATALNVPIPPPLVDAAPVWFEGWLARAPMLAAADRVAPAGLAAALGPVSSFQLVDLYGRVMDEGGGDAESPAGRLRAAYCADGDEARVGAMHAIWDAAAKVPDTAFAADERRRYAASILTARAAAAIAPGGGRDGDVAPLLAAMFAAGLDEQAARWAAVAARAGGADGDRAWSLLAVGAPRPVVTVDRARVESFARRAGDDGRHRTAMLAAALAGLGRLPAADAERVAAAAGQPFGAAGAYARALARALADDAPGTVALLVATGMQSAGWAGVPPGDFRHMIAALRAAGQDAAARMIAAEAMTRL